MERPRLTTRRLLLSPPALGDAAAVINLANDPLIAEFTLSVPYPYTEADLVGWLQAVETGWNDGTALVFAIRDPATEEFMGAAGLHLHPRYGHAELGFWMGRPFRGRGYVREAVAALIDYGFEQLPIQRIHANHRADNEASGRVLLASGLVREALLEQFFIKEGQAWDVVQYRLLRREWERATGTN
ncbi:RimJ/RimL family protein N-acetyltransferase [Lewinella marina]|uniref:GNAT family N-acetyltransferase n=1 Tax=Neolewinella marina TaxID=438751 RepID=A0A2G0CIV9_9BACT|nr:GNAT family N-acetyltransferase [Neolewinella marina]NJB84924.1 RimJ/RimL family protein N-acetyltransferase [Neolewinella marina]PHK99923.1 GNAT family N-acetyltransferase [Neolewinella marina]